MALPKDQSTTITVSAATRARLAELARDQDRPMGEIVTDLVERFGDVGVREPNAHLRQRAKETRLQAERMRADGFDPRAEIETLAADLFGEEEDRAFLLDFIDRGVIDDAGR